MSHNCKRASTLDQAQASNGDHRQIDRDPVADRVALQGFQVSVLARLPAQVAAFGIPHQQSPPLQVPADP